MLGCSSFLMLLPYALRYRADIEDITLDQADGRCRVIIRTRGKHWLPHRSVRSYVKESISRFRPSRARCLVWDMLTNRIHIMDYTYNS